MVEQIKMLNKVLYEMHFVLLQQRGWSLHGNLECYTRVRHEVPKKLLDCRDRSNQWTDKTGSCLVGYKETVSL